MAHGYYIAAGNKGYFYKTDAQKKTTNVLKLIIECIGTDKNKSQELIDRAKNDKITLDDFRRHIEAATLEKRTAADGTEYYRIWNKNCILNWPADEFSKKVKVFEQ